MVLRQQSERDGLGPFNRLANNYLFDQSAFLFPTCNKQTPKVHTRYVYNDPKRHFIK